MSLREDKKRATKESLRVGAMRLFHERGFTETSIDAIAAEAGVSRTTFFRYFPSKESVVFARQKETTELFKDLLRHRPPEENALQAFEGALLELARMVDTDPQARSESREREELLRKNPTLLARRAEYTEEQVQRMSHILAEREARSAPEPKHRLAAAIGLAVAIEATEPWQAGHPPESGEDLLRRLFAVVRDLTTDRQETHRGRPTS